MVGNTPAFREDVQLIGRVAQYDVPVLILDESGTTRTWLPAPSTTRAAEALISSYLQVADQWGRGR